MKISYWDIEAYDETNQAFTGAGTIPRPGISTLEDAIETNAETILLHDGSQATMTPETKYSKTDLQFRWPWQYVRDTNIYDKISTYSKNHTGVQITTNYVSGSNTSNVKFEGYLNNVNRIWLPKVKKGRQSFNLVATLKRIDINENGIY